MLTNQVNRPVALVVLFSAVLFIFALSTVKGTTGDQIEDMKIDVHWIDVFQLDDQVNNEVTENIWYNNTRDEPFTGELYTWLPTDSQLKSMCVVSIDLSPVCFLTAKVDSNIIKGSPFQKNPRNPSSLYVGYLSYYGQQETLQINASISNSSIIMPFEVLLAEENINEPFSISKGELTLSMDDTQLNLSQGTNLSIPKYLTLQTLVHLRNTADRPIQVDLGFEGVPAGWNVSWFGGAESYNATVDPNETREVALEIKVPNYIIELQVNYALRTVKGEADENSVRFEKEILYQHGRFEFYVYALPGSKVQFSPNIFAHYNLYYEPYGRNWFQSWALALEPETQIWATISWEGEGSGWDWMWLAVLIGVGSLFLVMALYRGKYLTRSKPSEEPLEEQPEEADEDVATRKKNMIEQAILELDRQHRSGLIDEELHQELSQTYLTKMDSLNKDRDP